MSGGVNWLLVATSRLVKSVKQVFEVRLSPVNYQSGTNRLDFVSDDESTKAFSHKNDEISLATWFRFERRNAIIRPDDATFHREIY